MHHPTEAISTLDNPLRRVKDALLAGIGAVSGTATWGGISGDIADQADLQAALSAATLADGDYGDVIVSGGGTIIEVEATLDGGNF